jgi:hypothetical protein
VRFRGHRASGTRALDGFDSWESAAAAREKQQRRIVELEDAWATLTPDATPKTRRAAAKAIADAYDETLRIARREMELLADWAYPAPARPRYEMHVVDERERQRDIASALEWGYRTIAHLDAYEERRAVWRREMSRWDPNVGL